MICGERHPISGDACVIDRGHTGQHQSTAHVVWSQAEAGELPTIKSSPAAKVIDALGDAWAVDVRQPPKRTTR